MFKNFLLCTCHLTVPTHESNYVYGYVRNAKNFSYKEIFTSENQHFEPRMHHSISMKILHITHLNIYQRLKKFQLFAHIM